MADFAVARGRRTGPIAEVRAAVAFLTRVPVAGRAAGVEAPATTGAAAFPLVGAALGALAAVPAVLAGPGHAMLGAILAVGVLAVLDGGLHLDGLADTIDALAAPPGAAERARTDPRAGSAGVVGIVVVLGIEVAAIAELAAHDALTIVATLVAAGAVSRASAPVLAVLVGRRRPAPSGLGTWFAGRVSTTEAIVATVVAAIAVAAAGVAAGRLVAAVAAGTVLAGAAILAVVRARGQLDGDGYGFAIEATLGAVLLAAALVP